MAPCLSVLRAPAMTALEVGRFCVPRARNSFMPIRNGGHGNVFVMRPSNYSWKITKDLMHLYIILGLMPTFLWSFFANMFIGPAELADIPEGYTPRMWEYSQHPITRFLVRYILTDPRKEYELYTKFMSDEGEKIILRKLTRRTEAFMSNRHDYQSWFYRPVEDARMNRFQRHNYQWLENMMAGTPSYVRDAVGFSKPERDDFHVEPDPAFLGVKRSWGLDISPDTPDMPKDLPK